MSDSARAFELTDLGNAERLVHTFGGEIRYCAAWKKWLVWDGRRWAIDATAEVDDRAAQTVRKMKADAANMTDRKRADNLWDHAHRSESHRKLRDMVDRASKLPAVQIAPAQFDTDPYLFNVRNGTVDLRDGKLMPHDAKKYITKLANVTYDASVESAAFRAFLARIFDNNAELMQFLQRLAGYTLTGRTDEQVLAILFGTGANGKSTLLEILRRLMGDYAMQADASTFLARREDGIRNDVARLQGARFVPAAEVTEGRRLNESMVKSVTGGDTVTARFLYSEPFDFRPQFKLWFAVNHKPTIRGDDTGIWRRIRLVPFDQCIPEDERDPRLLEKLTTDAELTGILSWAIAGCLLWQQGGLRAPAAVANATKDYRDEMDTLGAFIADRCIVGAGKEAGATILYSTFREWCAANGEHPMTQTAFGRRLRERGFDSVKSGTKKWVGIGVLSTQPSSEPPISENQSRYSDGSDSSDTFSESLPMGGRV